SRSSRFSRDRELTCILLTIGEGSETSYVLHGTVGANKRAQNRPENRLFLHRFAPSFLARSIPGWSSRCVLGRFQACEAHPGRLGFAQSMPSGKDLVLLPP